MNSSNAMNGEQGRIAAVSSDDPLAHPGRESPNKPVKPKVTSGSKISPKSLQRISQREDDHIGSKLRRDAAIASFSSKEAKILLENDCDSLLKSQSCRLVASPVLKSPAGTRISPSGNDTEDTLNGKTVLRNTCSLRKDNVRDHAVENVLEGTQSKIQPKNTPRKYRITSRRRAHSLDDSNSDENFGCETKSPGGRKTKRDRDVAIIAPHSLQSGGRSQPQTVDGKKISSRPSRNSRREIKSSNDVRRSEHEMDRSKNENIASETTFPSIKRSDDENRSCVLITERSTGGSSASKLFDGHSSGDFSNGSFSEYDDHSSFASSKLGRGQDFPLVDAVPSALRSSDNHYRRQCGGLPTFLFSPKIPDRTGRNKAPFPSRFMESSSSDSSDLSADRNDGRRTDRNDEAAVRLQTNGSFCPSISTCLGDSCVVAYDGAPNRPQRTSDGNYYDHKDDEIETATAIKYDVKSSAPLAFIAFISNEGSAEDSSISIESIEDDIRSVSSFCPSISECISTGTSVADEAPKLPGRRISQPMIENDSALGALDDN